MYGFGGNFFSCCSVCWVAFAPGGGGGGYISFSRETNKCVSLSVVHIQCDYAEAIDLEIDNTIAEAEDTIPCFSIAPLRADCAAVGWDWAQQYRQYGQS